MAYLPAEPGLASEIFCGLRKRGSNNTQTPQAPRKMPKGKNSRGNCWCKCGKRGALCTASNWFNYMEISREVCQKLEIELP